MSAAIERNAVKVKGRVLAISNAHDPGEGSDAEIDYENAGLTDDFLYDSVEAAGVEDRHLHPVEPRQLRLSARYRF
jgi:hypothetical protein